VTTWCKARKTYEKYPELGNEQKEAQLEKVKEKL